MIFARCFRVNLRLTFKTENFSFLLRKNGGHEILKKTEEKFSVLSSDEIGGGSTGSKICRLCLTLPTHSRTTLCSPLFYLLLKFNFRKAYLMLVLLPH